MKTLLEHRSLIISALVIICVTVLAALKVVSGDSAMGGLIGLTTGFAVGKTKEKTNGGGEK